MKINNLKINSIIINWRGYFQFAIFTIHTRKEKSLFGIYVSWDMLVIDFLFKEFLIWEKLWKEDEKIWFWMTGYE